MLTIKNQNDCLEQSENKQLYITAFYIWMIVNLGGSVGGKKTNKNPVFAFETPLNKF